MNRRQALRTVTGAASFIAAPTLLLRQVKAGGPSAAAYQGFGMRIRRTAACRRSGHGRAVARKPGSCGWTSGVAETRTIG